jgi:hypothetical protein
VISLLGDAAGSGDGEIAKVSHAIPAESWLSRRSRIDACAGAWAGLRLYGKLTRTVMWQGCETESGRKLLRPICRLLSLAVGRVEMILGVTLQFVR